MVRVRGHPNMELGVFLRCAGWNLSRAVAALKKRGLNDLRDLQGLFYGFIGSLGCTQRHDKAWGIIVLPILHLRASFAGRRAA